MIHALGVLLQAELREQGCPFVIVDRETFDTATASRQRIVIEYDKDGRDVWSSPRGLTTNPKRYFEYRPACKITIYAQSTKANAKEFEHENNVLGAAYTVATAMRKVMAAAKIGLFVPTSGGFITPPDLASGTRLGGAAYELKFTFAAGVPDVTWAGDDLPTFTIGAGAVTSTTKVSRRGDADDDDDPLTPPATAETACGA